MHGCLLGNVSMQWPRLALCMLEMRCMFHSLCSALCLGYSSRMENHPSQVACVREDTSCFIWFVLGKVGNFAHNTLGKGWGYPCIVSMKEGALCFSSKGLGVSFGGHSKVSGYCLLRQLVLQELLQHLRP